MSKDWYGSKRAAGTGSQMKDISVFGAISVGFLLLALSGLWSTLFPATSAWTDEKAAQRSEIQDRIHNLRFRLQAPPNQGNFHSHAPIDDASPRSRGDAVALQAELDELLQENEQLDAEFQSAYDRPNSVAFVLKWTGIVLAGLGILGYFAVRES